MSGHDPIGDYVAQLGAELGRHRLRRRLVGEVEAHLHEAVAHRVGAGLAPERAVSEAISSFGAPSDVAAALGREVPGDRGWPLLALAGAGAAVAAAFVALSGSPTSMRVDGESAAPRVGDVVRVSAVLSLSPRATDALARAQALGRRASACLLVHGGRRAAAGGISDPSGKAYAACRQVIEANERFLDGDAFQEVLAEAQPRFEAGERCAANATPRTDTLAHTPPDTASRGPAGCYRPDGLPATTA